ncbi:hypothetical protein [Halobellus ruber]|uniref:Uncharacterized protein n=1 Tax=Halobellus ruber TaxID=2761102 RepID=A0A7J9SLS4_9EURY|nr:hypothetical protein [Halobellus ruber]MBB6645971.1 hypothetical protein [Halobellus ruber]
MSAAVPPPEVDVPESWRLVSEETATPFDVRVVTIKAATRIYEDADLRERLAAATGTETTWRFVFASRVRIRPAQPASRALTELVSDRASSAFVDVLEARGFSAVDRADTHRFAVGGDDVEATRYRARVSLDDRDLPVEAYFAAWPADEEYLLGGGAYPLSLPAGEPFDRGAAREELFGMLRSIR